MKTELQTIDPHHPDPAVIARAAEILRGGGLAAFPTETVYGLGASALDEAAVAKIFAAKGRPAANPLIVHVASISGAISLACGWPPAAQKLAEKFWPGSLTLVLPKSDTVPDIVTAGGPTVALRVPAHPVALALLAASALPIAAPSANRSSHLSPTCAEHVRRDLDCKIDIILDGGPCPGGLESTVLDLTTSPPRILRPGLVTPAEIETVIGPLLRPEQTATQIPLRSPGLLAKHYAPQTPLECAAVDGWKRVEHLLQQGLRIGWLTFADDPVQRHPTLAKTVLAGEPRVYSAQLYAALHQLDDLGVDRIVVDLPPDQDDWLAVRDRLQRASAGGEF
jgi:L-threonylcarbamoyladenylate synthase